MPIKSYLAHPYLGKKNELAEELSVVDNVDVIVSENKDLLIVVTDTNNEEEEDFLKEKLDKIKNLKLLALVSGFNTPKND